MLVRISHGTGFLFRGRHTEKGDILELSPAEMSEIAGRFQPLYPVPKLEEVPHERPFLMEQLARLKRRVGLI